jgi:hypothetical protein
MKFLICPSCPEQIENGETEGLFQDGYGTFYNYSVKFDEDEMITITDSVGRYVPLDIVEVAGLANILNRIVRYQRGKALAEQYLVDELVDGATF